MLIKQQFFILLILFQAIIALAQKVEPLKYYKDQFPDDDAVILKKKEVVNIDINDSGLSIRIFHNSEKLFLNNKRPSYADEFLYINSFKEIKNIDAVYYIPAGKKYKQYKVTNIKSSSQFSKNVFFDDRIVKHIVFPKVIEGSKSVVSYEEIILDPYFLGTSYFASGVPIIEEEFTVVFPPQVKVKYTVLNDDGDLIQFSKKKRKDKIVYTWRAQNVEKIKIDEYAPSVLYYMPQIILYIDEYEFDGKTHKVLSDISQLYRWYNFLVKDVNQEPDPTLKIITDSLVIKLTTDYEKAKRIFYWVQDNIKYIAFEDGLGGFIPEDASLVCSKRYGDCKGMASIVGEMLKIAGIPVFRTWLGTRDIPYSYQEVPTPLTDNHMIVAINLDDNYYFLDATAKYIPFGMPSSFIQGKEALIGLSKDSFDLIEVPTVSMDKTLLFDSVFITVQEGELKGSGRAKLLGYLKLGSVRNMIDLPADKVEEAVQNRLNKGNNKFRVDTFNLRGLENRDDSLIIDYKCTIPDYIKNIEGKLYINMNLNKIYHDKPLDIDKRKADRRFEYKFTQIYSTVLEIPNGYSIDNLPENAKYENEYFGFEIDYIVDNNKLYQRKLVYINTLLFGKDHFAQWNDMIEKLNDNYRQVVVLKMN